jgi:hypothetical protein
MTNLLDSFDPEKAKCSICKEYFDKSALQNSRIKPGGWDVIIGLFCKHEEKEWRDWAELRHKCLKQLGSI